MILEDFTNAVRYAWKRKITDPRRLRDWQSRSKPFVHHTPNGRHFELYPDQSIDKCIFIDGAYELHFLQTVERFYRTRPGATMLDVGANIGNHSIYLAHLFSRIICLEPSPYIAERLRRNIALNGLDNIEVHAVGLSNRTDALPYLLDDSGNLGASRFVAAADERAVELPVRIGDELVSDLGVEHVDFIKVDVEHHEREVFEGLRATIGRYRPIIAFEFLGAEHDPSYLRDITSSLPDYVIAEATFAPSNGSDLRKFVWRVRHRGLPELKEINEPEPRFYQNVLAFPDQKTLLQFERQ